MRLLTIILATALPTGAWAQTTAKDLGSSPVAPPAGVWGVEWAASAEPTFQISRDRLPTLTLDDVQDEGEYSFGVTLSREVGPTKLSLTPLATLSPNLFDDDEEATAWSAAVRVQRNVPLSAFATANGTTRKLQDNLLPFAEYKFGRSYDGLFESRGGEERQWEAGVVYTNILSYLCAPGQSPGMQGGCPKKGLHYTVTPSYVDVDSSDDDDDRSGPKVALKLQTPFLATSALYFNASAERREYDSRLSDEGDGAEANRYVLGVGVDVSAWARRTLNLSSEFEVGLGFRWVKVEANRADMDRDDLVFLPTISWTR